MGIMVSLQRRSPEWCVAFASIAFPLSNKESSISVIGTVVLTGPEVVNGESLPIVLVWGATSNVKAIWTWICLFVFVLAIITECKSVICFQKLIKYFAIRWSCVIHR
jgi:hypothetical protein